MANLDHVAAILADAGGADAVAECRRLLGLLGAMKRHAATVGILASAVAHFLKVTRSHRPGLFACYDAPELPRTNSAFEQAFGSHRDHERRAGGRVRASAGTVVRGPVRLVASAANRLSPLPARDLTPNDLVAWRSLCGELESRRRGHTGS